MTVRPLKPSDLPRLAEMAERSGYPYPPPEQMLQIRVVEDDEGNLVMAGGICMIPEAYLWCGDFKRPLAKVHAIRLLHDDLAAAVRSYGFEALYAIPVPLFAKRFGYRLEKLFGWVKAEAMWKLRV